MNDVRRTSLAVALVLGLGILFSVEPTAQQSRDSANSARPQAEQQSGQQTQQANADQRTEPDPFSKPDDTWISIDGTVTSVGPDSFWLDYGDGTIVVEMDDRDREAEAYQLIDGDKVTVNGVIDDDFFESRTIEASSVFVEKLNTYFFASAVDEEDRIASVIAPVTPSRSSIRGTVTDIDINEFTLDTGPRQVSVEIDELGYNPLDDEGYLNIDVGDRVSVTGRFIQDFLEGRQLKAETLTELR